MNRTRVVSIREIFEEAGNPIRIRGDKRRADTGHSPVHSSRSGRCVALDLERNLWFCRACRQGGGIVEAVMSLRGCSRAEAIEWLRERGWLPRTGQRPRHRPRPPIRKAL